MFNQITDSYGNTLTLYDGLRVRLEEMAPDPDPIPDGTEGTITCDQRGRCTDDIGKIFVKWDNGRNLHLIPGEDKFIFLPNPTDQIDLISHLGEASGPLTTKYTREVKQAFNNTKPRVKIKTEVKKVKKSKKEEDLEETMTAGGAGGAINYSYTPKLENKIIKGSTFLNEMTNTGAISSTVDFLITNLIGWGTLEDISPPWPSLSKKSDNGQKENWWWQKIPTYNGGVITDLTAQTDETWDDDKLTVDTVNDLSVFKKEIDKDPKKYKQSVITIGKGFDLNIDPYNEDWRSSLQKGIELKVGEVDKPIQAFNVMNLKKEDIKRLTDEILSEGKKKEKVHTKKWDRCVEKVEKKNKENNTDYNPYAVCQKSIGYEGSIKKSHRREEELDETTTFGSVFGSGFPVTPTFAAKGGKHIPSKKPIWKGGQIIQKIENDGVLNESKTDLFTEVNKVKFVPTGGKYVKIKDRCAKYNNQPWCSQGAIDKPLELSDNTFENIKNISEKTGLSEEYIINKIMGKLNEK